MSKATFFTDNQLAKITAGTLTRVFNSPTAVKDVIEIPENAQVGPREWKDGNNETRQYFVFNEVTYNGKPRVEKSTSFLRSGDINVLDEKTIKFLNELAMADGLTWLNKVRGTKWECVKEDTRTDRNGREFKVFTWKLVA